ncbi:hypothetical protein TPHA_0E01670 [Tetrapisispora phaffii CBS 4417]|uniref:Uncharacterized protein n=1 Tax=Tetrapisispora phaffii (strain ATCC 24235 / CBS 4417 / NBRC 1672 / NRRL Y-8282 / UCD 70-5) TaxID=1071381 RepID=G8BTN2_TETPH|nr:hypothetical protein TPHA_0E01670 [Tetrapisispora phaffii CBS 4417]CCE63260.1 hypothetical protein TPHA_0E01670 [Tetrapisispora phaffii CBS 4417]
MSNNILQNYLLRELKNSSNVDTIDIEDNDFLILNCIYDQLLIKIIETANDFAKQDRSLDVLPEHINRAYRQIANEDSVV